MDQERTDFTYLAMESGASPTFIGRRDVCFWTLLDNFCTIQRISLLSIRPVKGASDSVYPKPFRLRSLEVI